MGRIGLAERSRREGRVFAGVFAVRCGFLEGKRAWEGRPEWRGSDSEVLCHLAVSNHGTLWGREPRRLAEPEPVKEIAQPLPTSVDGHDTAAAAAAAAQQNVEVEHPPHQGRP